MGKAIPKKAGAPMLYNNAIRVDEGPVKNSEALITSGGVQQAFLDYEAWIKKVSLLDLSHFDLGYFRIVVNDKSVDYGVEFNANGDPIRIYSMYDDEFNMEIRW